MKNFNFREMARRIVLLFAGLFVMAFGVALSIKANLGTSPISSVPYVISLLTGLTVGQITICMHTIFIMIQICLRRKKYEPIQLLQILMAVVFGTFTDFALWTMNGINCENYIIQLVMCVFGIVLVGCGVALEVYAKAVPLAGEGVVIAICQTFNLKFPKMKIAFDVTLVIVAIILSFVFLGELTGVREGTVVAAIGVGMVVKQVNKILVKFLPD